MMLQGHVTFLRHAGAIPPCPLTDITGGFNKFLAAAYGLSPTATAIQSQFGAAFGKQSAYGLCSRLMPDRGRTCSRPFITWL